MKSMNVFSKVFVLATLWTVVFLGLAGYAGGKAFQQDPDLVQKVSDKYKVSIHMGGMSKKYGSKNYVETKNSWTFPATATEINLKSVSGNFSIKKTSGTEIVVTATGGLDVNRGPQLLETKQDGTTLTLQEPDNEATRGLEVNIEIPASLIGKFEVETLSGDVSFENLQAKELTLKTVSGDMTLNQVTADILAIAGVSADLKATNCDIKKVTGKTVSGDVEFSSQKPAGFDITTVSGDIDMKLPKMENTKFDLSTTSGEIQNAHGSAKTGTLEVKIYTTSGDIEIQ
ncbi:hypothetical protein D3C87_1350050 [compost metagenome]